MRPFTRSPGLRLRLRLLLDGFAARVGYVARAMNSGNTAAIAGSHFAT